MDAGAGHDSTNEANAAIDAAIDAANDTHGQHAVATASDEGFDDAEALWQWPVVLHVTGCGGKRL